MSNLSIAGLLLVCGLLGSQVWSKPIALVYQGAGSCPNSTDSTGCSEAAKIVAEMAGFEVHYVGPNDAQNPLLKTAKVWIQPGGRARIQAKSMSADLLTAIKNFVRDGNGYVGFCAGAFLASETFGWDTDQGPFETNGLGMIPGKSHYYDLYDKELTEKLLAKIVPVQWLGVSRSVYWELGPYFDPSSVRGTTEVVSNYPELGTNKPDRQKILALRGSYGKGRYYVSAVHPEAPEDWRAYYHIKDSDGLDLDLAQSMIRWATDTTN